MLEQEVKATEERSSIPMPTHTGKQKEEMPTDLPTEVILKILFTNAKRLEKEALAQILTGKTPKGEIVTYIRMTGVELHPEKGFVLTEKESVGNVP